MYRFMIFFLLVSPAAHAQTFERFYSNATKLYDEGRKTTDTWLDENGHAYTVSVYTDHITCFRLKDWSFTIRGIKGGFHQFQSKDFCEVRSQDQ